MAVPSLRLRFDLRSEWHLGAGREAGAYADALVLKDRQQLPVLSGKSIKGLLRQAFSDAISYGWLAGADEHTLTSLFGQEGGSLAAQGLLRVGSATLFAAEIAFFEQHPQAKQQLYLVRSATAIDPVTGTARPHSLRTMETVVPMVLHCELEINALPVAMAEKFPEWLVLALPLIWSVGGKRQRGLGEVIVTLEGAK